MKDYPSTCTVHTYIHTCTSATLAELLAGCFTAAPALLRRVYTLSTYNQDTYTTLVCMHLSTEDRIGQEHDRSRTSTVQTLKYSINTWYIHKRYLWRPFVRGLSLQAQVLYSTYPHVSSTSPHPHRRNQGRLGFTKTFADADEYSTVFYILYICTLLYSCVYLYTTTQSLRRDYIYGYILPSQGPLHTYTRVHRDSPYLAPAHTFSILLAVEQISASLVVATSTLKLRVNTEVCTQVWVREQCRVEYYSVYVLDVALCGTMPLVGRHSIYLVGLHATCGGYGA